MVGARQLWLQRITNAGWQGQAKAEEDTQGSCTAGRLLAAVIAPAACRPTPLHIVPYLLLRQATCEEASDSQHSAPDEAGPSTSNKRRRKKDKALPKMTEAQREVMTASVLLCSYLSDMPQHDAHLCDFAAAYIFTSCAQCSMLDYGFSAHKCSLFGRLPHKLFWIRLDSSPQSSALSVQKR